MSFKTVKLKWANKLLKSKMFVVMTEKEGAIAIDGSDPYSFTDAVSLAAQAAELEMFHESLGQLIKDHKAALDEMSGVTSANTVRPTPADKAAEAATTSGKNNATKTTKARKPTRRTPAKNGGTKTPSKVGLKKAKK